MKGAGTTHRDRRSMTATNDEATPDGAGMRLVTRLLTYLRPYRVQTSTAGLLLVASAGLQVVAPVVTQVAVDAYLAPAAGLQRRWAWLPADAWRGLAVLSLLYLLVVTAAAVLEVLQTYLMQSAGQRAMSDLRRQVLSHLHGLDAAVLDRQPVGRLVTRATTDVDALNDLFASGLVAILADLVSLAFIAAAMLALSVRLSLVMFAVLPFVAAATWAFRRQSADSYGRARVAVARVNAFLAEHVAGMSVVQLFNQQRARAARFAAVNGEYRAALKDATFTSAWFTPVVEFQGMLAMAGLLAYAGVAGRGSVTVGVLVAFFQYALRFFRPIQELSDKVNVLQAATAAAEKVFALLDERPALVVRRPVVPVSALRDASIEFDRVWFAYRPGQWVLRDVSFTVPSGRTAAVVGPTGAGKTTLAGLVLRFYDVQRGAIRIGGVDVRDLDPQQLRRQFGVVLQMPHLFEGTLAENITLGARLPDAALMEIVARVGLDRSIDHLPRGLRTPARDARLSLGQMQLVAMARALAVPAPFLILDEATSSIDSNAERRLQAALADVVRHRTALVIAHRLSTIQRADEILVMQGGRIHEQGTHASLLAVDGVYRRLHDLQYTRTGRHATPHVARRA